MTPLLEGEALRLERGGRVLFDGLSLAVGAGEKVAVTGPSGTGKTSLLSVLAGLAAPQAGVVRRAGLPVKTGRLPDRTGAVLQGYGLVSLLTAAENVEVTLRASGRSGAAAVTAAAQALARLGLADQAGRLVQELSGGQQQRVAVARALASQPELLIADEPTAEQDPGARELVLSRLFAVTDGGGAIVLATHDPQVAARCDRVINLVGRPGGG